ncbi:hypothetical protein TWF718_004569 [Orbilia javanica]|uniref:Uncharacterized protein n=1 Tax=Orbilia javanica TaxID=47235 RepID=A0AAN8MVK8_9PEZI
MGGSAFSHHGILTPRMSPETYFKLKKKYHDILKGLYRHVTTPAEAPEKISYGDLDYLVAEPISKKSHFTAMKDVQIAFEAEYMTTMAGATTSFAVVLQSEQELGGNLEVKTEKTYAQVDVHICPSVDNMRWISFKHSYGDLWSILGMMGRAKGLVADENCLNVRVKEIEDHNRELAKVELTRDVNETLEFYGLDAGRFEKGFGSVTEVYEFLVETRFFQKRYFSEKRFANAHDRSKVGKREMMKGWFGFLGLDIALIGKIEGGGKEDEAVKEGGDTNTPVVEEGVKEDEEKEDGAETPDTGFTREQVLEEALERFGKRREYEEKVKAWRRNLRIDAVARGVSKKLVDGGHNSPRSARTKSSRIRKQINEGEMDEIFEMTEEQVEAFVQKLVDEILQSNAKNPNADTTVVGTVVSV